MTELKYNIILAKALTIHFQYQVSHKSNTKEDSGIIRNEITTIMYAFINGKPNPDRQRLLEMLSSTDTLDPIPISYIAPKFIKVTNKGTANPITMLMKKINSKSYLSLYVFQFYKLFYFR